MSQYNTAGSRLVNRTGALVYSRVLLLSLTAALSAPSLAADLNAAENKAAVQAVASQSNKTYAAQAASCPVDPSWITQPSLPLEVKKSGADGSSSFCDFYQFSTQAFLYLMSPGTGGSLRNFQQQSQFPLLEFNGDKPGNSCDSAVTGQTLRASLAKTVPGSSMSTGQAGSHATIYAQDGNVVYYDVRFNHSLCNLSASAVELQRQGILNFPAGTYELKFAWKLLSAAEIAANSFVMQNTALDGKQVTLGLLGMHLAIATKDHPEFVWTTYERKVNSPDCSPATDQSGTAWTFADKACTAGLPGTAGSGNACKFNQPPQKMTAPTGTPTNICRVYPYGTAPADLKAAENVADIEQQNAGIVAALSQGPASMQVLRNYFTVGALWVSDISKSSGGVGVPNERGSLRLANTVAETDFQQVDISSTQFISNCFGCHNYAGTSSAISNNITTQALSHTFRDIKIGKGDNIDVTAKSLIGNNSMAAAICGGNDGACYKAAPYLRWNGNWTNVNSSAGSVCGCSGQ